MYRKRRHITHIIIITTINRPLNPGISLSTSSGENGVAAVISLWLTMSIAGIAEIFDIPETRGGGNWTIPTSPTLIV